MSEEWKDEEERPFSFSSMWLGMKPETPEEKAARVVREAQKRAANELAVEHLSELPPFNPTPECPKCGYGKIKWRYGFYQMSPSHDDPKFARVGFHPYIALSCRRCLYGHDSTVVLWVMQPKS